MAPQTPLTVKAHPSCALLWGSTASSLWLLLLPVKLLKLHCHQISSEMVDEDMLFMGRRKLDEALSLVSYIRTNNAVPLFFKAVCQAYLSEHITQLCSTEHISSCAYTLPFSSVCPHRKL